jgi:serine/threonine-protein phosphatase 6 regulatory subunit 3
MSFWKTFGFHTTSSIDSILDRGDCSLEDLLDEEEILQECKAQNKRLMQLYPFHTIQ